MTEQQCAEKCPFGCAQSPADTGKTDAEIMAISEKADSGQREKIIENEIRAKDGLIKKLKQRALTVKNKDEAEKVKKQIKDIRVAQAALRERLAVLQNERLVNAAAPAAAAAAPATVEERAVPRSRADDYWKNSEQQAIAAAITAGFDNVEEYQTAQTWYKNNSTGVVSTKEKYELDLAAAASQGGKRKRKRRKTKRKKRKRKTKKRKKRRRRRRSSLDERPISRRSKQSQPQHSHARCSSRPSPRSTT